MSINLTNLKGDFIEYLQSKGIQVSEKTATQSIFTQYANELDMFLAEEISSEEYATSSLEIGENEAASIEQLNMIIDEILNTNNVDSTQTNNNDSAIDTEVLPEESIPTEEGVNTPIEDANSEENEEILVAQVIQELLEDEEFKKLIDGDGDDEISEEELKQYINSIKGLDGNEKNISLNDIALSYEKDENGNLKLSNDKEEIKEEKNTEATKQEKSSATQEPTGTTGTTGAQNTGTQSYTPSQNNETQTKQEEQPKSLENMQTSQEVQAELDTRKTTLTTKQEELRQIQNDECPELQKAMEEIKDEEGISLKEAEEEFKKQLEDTYGEEKLRNFELREEKETQKENNLKEIEIQNTNITQFDSEIGQIDLRLGNLSTKRTELEKAKNDPESESQAGIIEKQLEKLSQEEKALNAQKEDLEEQKRTAEEKISKLEKENIGIEQELNQINKELEEIDNIINQSETENEQQLTQEQQELKEKYEKYQALQQQFEEKKQELIVQKQAEIQEAQQAVNEAEQKLTEVLAKEAERKYSPTGITEEVATAVLAAIEEESLGLTYEAGGANTGECEKFGVGRGEDAPWCAGFVSWLYEKNGDDNPYSENSNRNSVNGFLNYGKENGYYSDYNGYTPVPGDVMIQKENGNSHTGIVIGTEGNIVYVIEGNTSDDVAIKAYTLGLEKHDKISGFIRTNEMTGGSSEIPGDIYLTDDVRKRLPERTNDSARTKTR